MHYRKKTLTEAFRLTDDTHPDWFQEALEEGKAFRNPDGSYDIHTLEGVHLANLDDWIARGVKGELYPIKPDIFAETYEPVEAATVEAA